MKRYLTAILLLLGATASSFAQSRTITGLVSDENGEPLVGAMVLIDGTKDAVLTDLDGKYSITAAEGQTLKYSFIGLMDAKEKVGAQKTINVTLYQSANELDQVVVIGYGKVKKSDLTGSVANVDMKSIAEVPVTSVDHALQGRVAGADIMSTTGEPGATTSIRIRGTRSITATNEPLIVVDGVMDGINDLNDIAPGDIESITVLKDASSTAIYGSRGSNGVIVITTKQGTREGKPSITFRADGGFSQLPTTLDVMNATEFAKYRNDLAYFLTSDSYGSITSETPQSSYPYPTPEIYGEGTDWIKEITRIAPYQNYTLSISGKTAKGDYFASFGYNDNRGIIDDSGEKKYLVRLNLDRQLFKWLDVGLRANFTYRDQDVNKANITGTNWWSSAVYLSPLLAPTASFNNLWYSGQHFNSPRTLIDQNINKREHLLLNGTGFVQITPLKNFIIKSQFSYKYYQRHSKTFSPSTLPARKEGEGASASRGEYDDTSISSENTITYAFDTHKHAFDFLAGFTAQWSTANNMTMSGNGYNLDQLTWNNMGAILDKQNLTVGTSNTEWVKESVLARVNYNYDSRYYITITGRADGASNFAANKKWAFFPSAAFKWNVHNETFLKNARGLDELALRLSAGRSGNDGISAYQSLARINSTTSGYVFNESQPLATYVDRLASNDLTWEITDMYNVAIDASFIKNRINTTVEVYYADTRDLLLTVQVPSQTGYTSVLSNAGRTSNKGVEFTLQTYNILKPNFSWSTDFTISHNTQMVEDIASEDFVVAYAPTAASGYMMYGYVKGYPLNALWGFQDQGTWKTQEEIDRNKITKAYVSKTIGLGQSKYNDINHDGVLNKDDLVYLGSADPVIYGGLQNTFNFFGFNLNIFFTYSLGGKIYNVTELYMGNGSQFTNQMRYMQNAWHPTRNPDSDIPRAGSYDQLPSSRIVYDASYLRLKELSLNYTFDMRKATNNILRDIKIGVSANNLFLWKYYAGFDPDVSSSSSDSALRRIDIDAYPKARTVIFSVQLRY